MDNSLLTVNTLRLLSVEGIEKANSGHPGICLGSAPIAYTLFQNFLTFNPANSKFVNRDRFVLSAGHGSMLNYALLHLYGYKVSLNDLQQFRQYGSITPGHPEFGVTDGIETSTGPLGQGIANAVGMAIAETHLAKKFNREGFNVVDHYTYALCGDGCLMEGIEYESASLAGTLKLGKLIVFYDSNNITIEGDTSTAFTEDVKKRHEAQGWQVIDVSDGNDINAIKKAVKKAKAEKEKPSLIVCHTTIGYGAPNQGSAEVHGAPLGADKIKALRENLNYSEEPFTVSEEVYAHTKKAINRGKKANRAWKAMFKEYSLKYPELAKEFLDNMSGKLPVIDDESIFEFEKQDASRSYGGIVLNKISKFIPNLFGGSADLTPSTKAVLKGVDYYSSECREGKNVHFGIREHAMSAICNGIACHGGLLPFCSTFFVFSDYMKNGMRLSALMDLNVTYVLTHDSIGVGEDGPTHQPIEQLVGLRSMPNMKVYRPCDGLETACAFLTAFTKKGPTSIILTRQTLINYGCSTKEGALKGGYVFSDCDKKVPDLLLIGCGSEVQYCMEAQQILKEQGISARVISMPCQELFESQSNKYKESVIPSNVRARVCVEAGSSYSWYKYAGIDGKVIGIDKFGASGKASTLFKEYGFTTENVVKASLEVLKK